MDLRSKSILVIGGAGFIGSYVVGELLKEDVGEVVVYDNFCRGTVENLETSLKDPRCKVFEAGGDILQDDILKVAVSNSDAIIHLAALWLLQCKEFPKSAFETNIRGTYNVLETCVQYHTKRLVYSSSASVYGDAIEEPMTEDHPFNNWTFYGATKIAGEQMFKAFHRRYGLCGSALRYMNVYGPGQDYNSVYTSVIMRTIDRILVGDSPVIYGDGKQSYDFIYVRDVARANVLALKSDIPLGFYNVGSGIKTSIKDLTELLMDLMGCRDRVIKYEPMGETFVTNRVGSTTKAREELGFKYWTSLKDGLVELIKWRRQHC